jgi:hypothetical protein
LARTRGRRSVTLRPPSTTSLGTVPAREACRSPLMLIARATDGRPIVFEHRLQDLQARGDREFHQLRTSLHEEIDEWQMALGEGIDLVRPIDCARLSFHGGSLLAGVRPGLVTTRLSRAVRSRRSQISTATGTSPRLTSYLRCSRSASACSAIVR